MQGDLNCNDSIKQNKDKTRDRICDVKSIFFIFLNKF